MARLWLKSCPFCQGDLYEDAFSDPDEVDNQSVVSCLQCGHVLSEDEEVRLRNERPFRKRRFPSVAHTPSH